MKPRPGMGGLVAGGASCARPISAPPWRSGRPRRRSQPRGWGVGHRLGQADRLPPLATIAPGLKGCLEEVGTRAVAPLTRSVQSRASDAVTTSELSVGVLPGRPRWLLGRRATWLPDNGWGVFTRAATPGVGRAAHSAQTKKSGGGEGLERGRAARTRRGMAQTQWVAGRSLRGCPESTPCPSCARRTPASPSSGSTVGAVRPRAAGDGGRLGGALVRAGEVGSVRGPDDGIAGSGAPQHEAHAVGSGPLAPGQPREHQGLDDSSGLGEWLVALQRVAAVYASGQDPSAQRQLHPDIGDNYTSASG